MPQQQMTLRQQVEAKSRPVLTRLHALPRLLIPIGTVVLVAIGAFAPMPYAIVPFTLILLFIAWISYLSWPVVPLSGRLMRLAMLILIVVLAVTRF